MMCAGVQSERRGGAIRSISACVWVCPHPPLLPRNPTQITHSRLPPQQHTAERAATDRVVCLGGHYAALRAFVDRHRYCVGGGGASLVVGKSSASTGSLYLQALSAGIDELLAE